LLSGSNPRVRLTIFINNQKQNKMQKTAQKTAKKVTATTTKVTEAVKLSSFDKKMIRLGELKAKKESEGLNLAELKSLVNTLIMLEDKSPSAVFNRLTKSKGEIAANVKLVLGKSAMPSYNEFLTELTKKNKALYSTWDGINVLAKFNKLAQTKTKVEKQNKVVSAI
jgi:hypothetical protein